VKAVLLLLLLVPTATSGQDFDALVPGATATHQANTAPRPSPPVAPALLNAAPARPPAPPPATTVAPQAATSTAAPVTIRTSLERTATWIGDPLTYEIEVVCPPGTDILQADISRDRIRVTGLEVRDARSSRTVASDGTLTYRTVFTLVGFTTDRPLATIEPQPVRYYVHTAGQAPDTLTPADEVTIASSVVALRSVLPDATVTWLRDQRRPPVLPSAVGYAGPVGVALMLIAIAPLCVGLIAAARRVRLSSGRTGAKRPKVRRQSLDAIQAAVGLGDVDGRRDALARLSAAVREQLGDEGIPAGGLTPEEIGNALRERVSARAVDDIESVLRACEHGLYAPAAFTPGQSAVTEMFQTASRALAAKAR